MEIIVFDLEVGGAVEVVVVLAVGQAMVKDSKLGVVLPEVLRVGGGGGASLSIRLQRALFCGCGCWCFNFTNSSTYVLRWFRKWQRRW